MRVKKLAPRLAAMADFVSAGESIADIGADHGYLPIHLLREEVIPFAILSDVQKGPLEKTRLSVEKAISSLSAVSDGAEERISLRLGDGLSVVEKGEVDIIVIAGMGSETIIKILSAEKEKTVSFGKFILQPRTKTELLKEWIASENWSILAETKAEERGRLCDIIVCAPPICTEGKSKREKYD